MYVFTGILISSVDFYFYSWLYAGLYLLQKIHLHFLLILFLGCTFYSILICFYFGLCAGLYLFQKTHLHLKMFLFLGCIFSSKLICFYSWLYAGLYLLQKTHLLLLLILIGVDSSPVDSIASVNGCSGYLSYLLSSATTWIKPVNFLCLTFRIVPRTCRKCD